MYELAFLLFRVKEAAQVEDNGQKEHEAGHGEDRHRLLTGDGTVEAFTPEPAGHVHRILHVDTQSPALVQPAVQSAQVSIDALTAFAQLGLVSLLILLKAGEGLIEGCQEDQRVIVQTVVTFSDTVVTAGQSPNVFYTVVEQIDQHQSITVQEDVLAAFITWTHLV